MNLVSRLFLSLIMMVGLADAILAQGPRARSQRVDPLTSSISGRVTTADTGTPVRGAEVRLSMDGRFSRLVTTTGEGRFELRNLPAGEYRLAVSKTGFITLEYGQQRPFETAATITLGEGQSATGNVGLLRGGTIFGRVLDEFGDPSVGTRVQVLRNRAETGGRRLLPVGMADQTDDTGAFRIYGLPPGEYYVAASTGLIDAVKRDPPVYYPGTTSFAEAQPLTIGAGAEASAEFQIIDVARAATVSGVVLTSSGAPAPGAMINLLSNTLSATPGAQGIAMLHADAGPQGTFSIQNVPPGPYTLTAQMAFDMGTNDAIAGSFRVSGEAMREQMLNRLPETASMQINVTSDGVSGVTLNTRRGGRVTGRYVADTGVSRPLPTDLGIALRGSAPGNAAMHMTGATAADFELAGLSGPSRVEVQGIPDGWAVKAILLDGEDVTDAPFDLSGKTGTMRVVMTDRLTSLSGTVQSDRSRRDHNIVVFTDDATKWIFPSRFVRTIRADADGRFEISGLPPGERYFVAAVDYLEAGEEQDRQLLNRLRSRATSVTLSDGEQHSIQLDLLSR
ncbi:MAG TPA: carboxypeptidase-like regulatory domain-containing protein [Vicinamibacterales bacterium]|nr:carboxypeptidase-like regulatory domain-containing protein [Vicinamibacterales bacterium]